MTALGSTDTDGVEGVDGELGEETEGVDGVEGVEGEEGEETEDPGFAEVPEVEVEPEADAEFEAVPVDGLEETEFTEGLEEAEPEAEELSKPFPLQLVRTRDKEASVKTNRLNFCKRQK